VAGIGLLPVAVGLGKRRIEDVPLQPDGHLGPIGPIPAVVRGLVRRAPGGAPPTQDLRDLLRAVVLLCDDQSHLAPSTVAATRDVTPRGARALHRATPLSSPADAVGEGSRGFASPCPFWRSFA